MGENGFILNHLLPISEAKQSSIDVLRQNLAQKSETVFLFVELVERARN